MARGRRKAADALAEAAGSAPSPHQHQTLIDCPRGDFARKPKRELEGSRQWTSRLAGFHKKTLKKVKDKKLIAEHQLSGHPRPYGVPPLIYGTLFPEQHGAAQRGAAQPGAARRGRGNARVRAAAPLAAPGAKVRVLDTASTAVPLGESLYHVMRVGLDGRPQSSNDVLEADIVILDAMRDLDEVKENGKFLELALLVVAAGKPVVARGDWMHSRNLHGAAVVRHAPAASLVARNIVLGGHLPAKHKALAKVFKRCASLPKSKWRIVDADPAAQASASLVTVSNLAEAAQFIRSVRRIDRHGLGGKYFPRPCKTLGKRST